VDDDVMISVDPHKASNTAAVMDPVTKVVIASQRFANTSAGYRQLRDFSGRWEQRRWAVEGCHSAGRSLSQRLVADGELVLDVPAKLAARVRVYSQGHGRKSAGCWRWRWRRYACRWRASSTVASHSWRRSAMAASRAASWSRSRRTSDVGGRGWRCAGWRSWGVAAFE
jgi:hypothetical protein